MSQQARNRDLSLIRESGSTARVLNLALTFERFGEEAEYAEKPLFKNKRLNRAIVVKHAMRLHERDLFKRAPVSATKIVLPFAPGELHLGGASIFVDQYGFEKLLREGVGGYSSEIDLDYDMRMLRLLATLPSFDPFLMRERLRQSSFEPARCYFDVSEADVTRMRAFVGAEIAELVGLAFANGGSGARQLSEKLAHKLLTDEAAESLDPLRQTLRLSGDEYREGVFAWKGFLYYKWLTRDFTTQFDALKRAIATIRISKADAEQTKQLNQLRRRTITHLNTSLKAVDEALLEYGCAFASLAEGQAGRFREFLINAPARFIPIGEAVGVAQHIQSFWRFRFPAEAPLVIDVEDAFSMFEEFDATLDSIEFIRLAAIAAANAAA